MSISFDPSGTRIVRWVLTDLPVVVDLRSGDEVLNLEYGHALEGFGRAITVGSGSVEWSPDGAIIAATAPSGGVFDARTGRLRFSFATGPEVRDVAFSADGSRLAATTAAGTVQIWDIDTGQQQLVLRSGDTLDEQEGLGPRPGSIIFSPDSTKLLQATGGPVWSWPLNLDEAMAFVKDNLTRTLTHEECQQYLHVDHCP